jgi:hypothetical protein
MVVRLTKEANLGVPNLLRPASRHITVACEQDPTISAAFRNDLGVFYILPFREMVVVHHNVKACLPQLSWQVFSP